MAASNSSGGASTSNPYPAQVFWPEDCLNLSGSASSSVQRYYLVGWNIHKFKFCVATVLPCPEEEGLEVREEYPDVHSEFDVARLFFHTYESQRIKDILQRLAADPRLSAVHAYCSRDGSIFPMVLGEYRPAAAAKVHEGLPAVAKDATVWLVVNGDQKSRHLGLHSLHCCGCPYRTKAMFLLYPRCNHRLGHYVTMKTTTSVSSTMKLSDLDYTLHQINSAGTVEHEVRQGLLGQESSHGKPRMRPVGDDKMKTTSDGCNCGRRWQYLFTAWRFILDITTRVQTLTPSQWGSVNDGSVKSRQSVIINSLTCGHIQGRCRNLALLPSQLRKLRRGQEELHLPAEKLLKPSIKVYSYMIHVIADTLLGICFGAILYTWAGAFLDYKRHWADNLLCIERLRQGVSWLNHYPAGFKLNVPLTERLGSIALMVLEMHAALLYELHNFLGSQQLHRAQRHLLQAFALLGSLGATTMLACALDLLRLVTMHITLIFAIFARLYHLELSFLVSLWHLFRGKKQNVLRHRIDTCEYSTQQLLLGTLLFTIFIALFPTIAVFYAFFLIIQIMTFSIQGVLWLLYIMWRDLPLYGLWIFLNDPGKLPCDVWVERDSRCRQVKSTKTEGADGDGNGIGAHAAKEEKFDDEKEEAYDGEENVEGDEDGNISSAATSSFMRLKSSAVPFSKLFEEAYGKLWGIFVQKCPGLGGILKVVLTGELVSAEAGEQGGKAKLWLLHYKSLGQILTDIALSSYQHLLHEEEDDAGKEEGGHEEAEGGPEAVLVCIVITLVAFSTFWSIPLLTVTHLLKF